LSATISKSDIYGSVNAPPSKSMTHRHLITAALAEGVSVLESPLVCDDTVATVSGLKALGIEIREEGESWVVEGGQLTAPSGPIDCNQSGTTLRLLLGTCSLLEEECIITGAPQLLKRPNAPLLGALEQLGIQTESEGGYPPIKIKGKMKGGVAEIRGDVSSQFISSIILAAPYADEPVTIKVTTRLESKPYVQMTLDAMRRCGVRAISKQGGVEIKVPQGKYKPTRTRIEGDWSSAAFMLAAGALSGKVHVDNLDMDSSQADKEIMHALDLMGAQVKVKGNRVTTERSYLRGIEMDLSDSPDMFPIVSSLCAIAKGRSTLTGLGRLRLKESDRLQAMAEGLIAMGARIQVEGNTCIIEGGLLKGAVIDPHGDHRIAMSFAVLGTLADGETTINDRDCVNKSYPRFWDDLASLGAEKRRTE
jgi:3-phosphoshikimate 1-carboxyvinyltransferase